MIQGYLLDKKEQEQEPEHIIDVLCRLFPDFKQKQEEEEKLKSLRSCYYEHSPKGKKGKNRLAIISLRRANPFLTIRNIASKLNISESRVFIILKTEGLVNSHAKLIGIFVYDYNSITKRFTFSDETGGDSARTI